MFSLACCLCAALASRSVLFWLEPYENLTSVQAYSNAWRQFGSDPNAKNFIMAGSAYAAKVNGSLGCE